jgi:thiamine-phosphate pyrophosphorylase
VIPLSRKLLLYVLVDPAGVLGRTALEQAGSALRGGATAIQLRGKGVSARELASAGKFLKALCREKNALFIVNDRLDVALACGADGVHLGTDDLSVKAAREIAPEGFVIGASAHDPEEAREAERQGADYLGVGAVFRTQTKGDARATGIAGLRAVVESTVLPCVGIGGITPRTAPGILPCGACGVAVHAAVVGADDVETAARDFRSAMDGGGTTLA